MLMGPGISPSQALLCMTCGRWLQSYRYAGASGRTLTTELQ